MARLESGEYGGQCVKYAGMTYFGKSFGVDYAREVYDASTVRKLNGPKSGCIACWGDGSGHVGVVEVWDSKTKTMTYSDSNRNWDEIVHRDEGITEEKMKKIASGFQGYVEFK